jgi:hypothetical protein
MVMNPACQTLLAMQGREQAKRTKWLHTLRHRWISRISSSIAMATLRSLAFFAALYLAFVISWLPLLASPSASAFSYLLAGALLGFPVDRVYVFWIWASESLRRIESYRTCVIATPRLQTEQRNWHLIGHVHRYR